MPYTSCSCAKRLNKKHQETHCVPSVLVPLGFACACHLVTVSIDSSYAASHRALHMSFSLVILQGLPHIDIFKETDKNASYGPFSFVIVPNYRSYNFPIFLLKSLSKGEMVRAPFLKTPFWKQNRDCHLADSQHAWDLKGP